MAVAFDLDRFVAAQEPVYARVRAELAAGAKTSHWMWFVFPQLRGLGRSATAQHFGIENRVEAEAYLRHPVLGERLRECTRLVLAVRGRDATGIFGTPDDMKLHSSMTLFAEVTDEPLFAEALERYFGGRRDARTLQLLKERAAPAS